ncbi:MAG: AAA family ATPase [Actinomycetes bacterium]
MGTTEVRAALAIAVQIGQPVLLWGDPGQGKTSVLLQVADALDRPCEVVVGSIREAADFAGLPMRVGDSVTFVPPSWAVRCVEEPRTVVFLDELTTAPPSVQAAMLRIVLDREVGDLRLPDTVSIVAAANPPESSAGGDDLSAPLANRFCHLDWEVDARDWVAGLVGGWPTPDLPRVPADIAAFVHRWEMLLAGFITARPTALSAVPDDIGGMGRAWPSPRMWTAVSRVAAAADAAGAHHRVRSLLVNGLVGEGPGMEFLRYADRLDLPDPEDVLADPTQLSVSVRSDLLLAALAGVTAAVASDCTEERWHAAFDVLAHVCAAGQPDVAALAANHLLPLRQSGWSAPSSAAAFLPVLRDAALV